MLIALSIVGILFSILICVAGVLHEKNKFLRQYLAEEQEKVRQVETENKRLTESLRDLEIVCEGLYEQARDKQAMYLPIGASRVVQRNKLRAMLPSYWSLPAYRRDF